MTRPARFGVTLPQIKRTWAEARDAALEIDRLGFDSVWVCDHLYGVPMPNLPIFEAWSELAAVAAITERVELGTLVTPPFFRNPAVLAKQVATIDQIAGGRVDRRPRQRLVRLRVRGLRRAVPAGRRAPARARRDLRDPEAAVDARSRRPSPARTRAWSRPGASRSRCAGRPS